MVRIEAHTEKREQEITAEVQAQYGFVARAEGKVTSTFSMSSSEHRVEIMTYQKGGVVDSCGDLADLFRLAQAALDDARSGRAYPYGVMLDRYTELRLPNDNASFIDVEAARETLQRLAKNRTALRQMQNEIDYVLRHQDWFESPDVAGLNAANRLITEELEKITEHARVCARDFAAAQDYSPTFPDLARLMPERKAGADPSGRRRQIMLDRLLTRNPEVLANIRRQM